MLVVEWRRCYHKSGVQYGTESVCIPLMALGVSPLATTDRLNHRVTVEWWAATTLPGLLGFRFLEPNSF
jgi:hypothetical protein